MPSLPRSTIPSMLFGLRESRAKGDQRDVNKQWTKMQIYSIVHTAVLYTKLWYGRSHVKLSCAKGRADAEVTRVKSWFCCCVRFHYKTPCEVSREVRKISLWLAIFRAWNLVQLLGNFHPNFTSFQAQWEWPSCFNSGRCIRRCSFMMSVNWISPISCTFLHLHVASQMCGNYLPIPHPSSLETHSHGQKFCI